MLGHKRSEVPSPKMLTDEGDLLHREEGAFMIHLIKDRLEQYLEGPTKLGIAEAHETNTAV